MRSEELICDLIERTRGILNQLEQLSEQTTEELNWKPAPDSWSALECMEHLVRYGKFYLPEIRSRIAESNHAPRELFKTGLLGDYFAKSLAPKEKLNKMKTFQYMNPNGSKLDHSVLYTLIAQQKEMLDLLDLARGVDLTKTKTSISISKLIKLRLGDTFRVVIYHEQRHMVQVANVLSIS